MHASLADQLLDLVQNALEAGSSHVEVQFNESDSQLEVVVQDNGFGMSESMQERVFSPFYTGEGKHRHRRFGLGLSFLKQMVDATGGTLALESQPGEGTCVRFRVNANHPDLPQAGDLPGTFAMMMTFEGAYELTVDRRFGTAGYQLSRKALEAALGELRTVESVGLLKDYAVSQEETMRMQKGN